MKRLRLLGAIVWLSIAGCSSPNVFVVDERGDPIEGATIIGSWPSTGGVITTTDGKGCARIETTAGSSIRPAMLSFSVSKPGFEEISIQDLRPEVFRITLRRSSR